MADRLQYHENAKERLDPTLLQVNLEEEATSLRREEAWDEDLSNQITLVHDGPLRVALFAFRDGAVFRDHRVSGPITVQVLKGRARFTTEDGHATDLAAGDILSLSGGITHNVEALEDMEMLLTVVQVGEPARQPEREVPDRAPAHTPSR